jgi:glycosyltransferase involved in cell wall biosynthesis
MTGTDCGFSVVIPTCNRPVQLGVCLRALAGQDYPKSRFEVIVVDDGSVAPTAQAISELDLDLDIHVIRQSNQGPGAARNAGATQARGTYLAFTDDDCVPETGWLSAFSTALSSAAGPVLAGGRVVNGLPESLCSTASQLIVDLVYEYYNSAIQRARFFASNNMALPSAGFREVGGFDPNFRTSEDRDLCDRWLERGHMLVYAPEARISHSHQLSLVSFCRQHLGYGRGAFRYYQGYQSRHRGASSIDPAFYRSILHQLPRRLTGSVRQRVALLFLLVVWQVANTVGFILESMSASGGPGRTDGDTG